MNRALLVICVFSTVYTVISSAPRLLISCPEDDICALAGQKIEVEGEIVSLRSERLKRTFIEVRANGPRQGSIQVVLPHTQYDFQYGDKVILKGKLKLPNQDSEDNFSYPLYLAGKGIYSVMSYPEIVGVKRANSKGIFIYFYSGIIGFREKVRGIINQNLSEPDSSILNAMIIGDQGGIPQELRQELSRTGVIHILSVSGAHVTLVIAILLFLISRITYSRLAIFFFVALGVGFYLILSGSPNCASRSAIMGLLVFMALYGGRKANFRLALWVSAAILLFINPMSIFSDVGFELSYLAVIGIVYVYPPLHKSLAWGRTGAAWKAVDIFMLSISIGLTTTPLVYYYFGIISWISPMANLILLPLFSLVLPAGFLLTVLGFSPKNVAEALAILIHFLLRGIQYIIDLILKIPGSYSEGGVKPGWIILYYFLLFLVVSLLSIVAKKYIFPRRLDYFGSEEFLGQDRSGKYSRINKKYQAIRKKLLSEKVFVAWSVVLCGMLLVSGSYFHSSSRSPRLAMLNVGQGDAFLLDWPRYHLQILVDGGPGRNLLSELGNVLPFYDRKIELLVLSHPHQDHLEGLVNVIHRYKTGKIVLNSLPQDSSPELSKILWNKAIENNIPTVMSEEGQKIFIDTSAEKIAELEFLTPFFDYSDNRIKNANDQSAVLKMNYPRKILFMGDSSSNIERILLSKESHNLQSEVLKVGHHGSRFSTTDEFLDTVQPQTALIGVGKDNLFGHPARSTIQKLEERNIKVYRTDNDGRIIINL